jgi:ATP synthase protein I
MNKKGKDDNPWRAAGMVGAMGVDVAVCVYLGFFLGDRLGGTKGWVAFGIVAGLAVGILTCVLLVKRLLEDPNG